MITPSKRQTIDCLTEISDEVRGFHPILSVLFRKLPGIVRVHYNQGPNEMGADFILFKEEPALLRETHVGVIVKVGSIKQNTTEVERQIKECFISRRCADITDIQIREVWVVSSKEISRNARDVLSSQYGDRKIEFIAGQDLATLIDKYAPDSFTSTSPALQDFAERTLLSIAAEEQRALVIPGVERFYIEPHIVRKEFDVFGNYKSPKPVKSINDLLDTLIESNVSIIQAGAGGGKSSLARELSKTIIESSNYSEGKIIPTIVHAREISKDPERSISDLADELRSGAGLAHDSRVIIFIDGLDEIDVSDSERSVIINNLTKVAGIACLSIVVLSRPFDEVTILGGKVNSLDVFRISPLKGTRALNFIKKVAGQSVARSRLAFDLSDSLLLRALDGAPIAYILLGRLIAENQQDLPSNLTELFQKYCELVLGRWEISKGLRSQKEYEVLVETLVWLSQYMMDNGINEVSQKEVERWVQDYSSNRGIHIQVNDLVERVCARNSILYLRKDIGVIGFRHRAFCEFFYAKSLSERKEISLGDEIFTPYWVNTYYFFAGIKRDCPDLVGALVDLELKEDHKKIMRVLNLGNILLAGYLTPISFRKDALKKVASEACQLFLSACDPKSASPLTVFPTLQVLGVLTLSFRMQYGYSHLKEAIEEAIFELEELESSEENAITLFILDVAYKEAGGDLRFDTILEKFGEALPITLKFAIHHESERMNTVTDKIKRMERNLRRSFKGRNGVREFLRKMYRVPVRKLDKSL